MIFASMQPYFFPYIGYFSLFHASSAFQFFDTPQFTKKTWMSRNRIQSSRHGGVNYIIVPLVKHPFCIPLNCVHISGTDWKIRVIKQLEFYKKKAPYFKQVVELVKDCLEPNYTLLSRLNIETIIKTCHYIGLYPNYSVFSETGVSIEYDAPDETLLKKAVAFGYSHVINAPGAISFYDKKKYDNAGIKLQFVKNRLTPYEQGNENFIPGLSIIDVLMFNSPKDTLAMVADYDLL